MDALPHVRVEPRPARQSEVRERTAEETAPLRLTPTPESSWQDAGFEETMPRISAEGLVPPGDRAVVIAPHPDDEVLGTGGLLAALAEAGRAPLVISVTDGEACHGELSAAERQAIGRTRRAESFAGMQHIGVDEPSLRALRIPDGQVTEHEHDLRYRLRGLLRPTDVVFAPRGEDGHPDHEATGRAAAWACLEVGAVLWEVPVWTWLWSLPGDPRVPWDRAVVLPLDEAARGRKRAAIGAHRSQVEPRHTPSSSGNPLRREPSLPDRIKAYFERDFEVFFRVPMLLDAALATPRLARRPHRAAAAVRIESGYEFRNRSFQDAHSL